MDKLVIFHAKQNIYVSDPHPITGEVGTVKLV